MNDFTKEELQQICQFFNIAIEDFQEPESTYRLRDKVQSMIDNYDVEVILWRCEKCGHAQ